MKTIFASLLTLLSFVGSSQIIEVSIERWGNYSHPETMTLHTAMEMDSVTTSPTRIGMTVYTFNFTTNEIVMVDCKDVVKKFNIVKVLPTKSILNVDAEIEGRYYNFVVAENDSDDTSLVIQKFIKENGRSTGLFSNNAKVIMK
jgi:hypothetical protein